MTTPRWTAQTRGMTVGDLARALTAFAAEHGDEAPVLANWIDGEPAGSVVVAVAGVVADVPGDVAAFLAYDHPSPEFSHDAYEGSFGSGS